jgi:hypothetical protein
VDNRQAQLLLQQQAAAAAAAAAGDPGAAAAAAAGLGGLPGPGDPMKEVIVLAACQGNELLPQVRGGGEGGGGGGRDCQGNKLLPQVRGGVVVCGLGAARGEMVVVGGGGGVPARAMSCCR